MDTDPLSIILLQTVSTPEALDWVSITIYFFLFLLTLGGSFFASSSEVAFFSLKQSEQETLEEENPGLVETVNFLIQNPKKLIATVLITNNFVNIFGILIGSYLIHTIGGHYHLSEFQKQLLDFLILTPMILIGGEIIPKVYASRYKLIIIRNFGSALRFLMKLYSPLISLLVYTTQFIDKRVKSKQENASLVDLREAIDLIPENPSESQSNKGILKGVLNFSSIEISSIMRARTQVVAVEKGTNFPDLIEIINEHGFSRLPVYNENLDKIEGILHIKDLLPLLQNPYEDADWEALVRPAFYFPETKKIDTLLEDFKKRHYQLAIVVDEFGGTAGIVTFEDISDEIFGEIRDEFDVDDVLFQEGENGIFRFHSRIPFNDFLKTMELEESEFKKILQEQGVNTLSGLIYLLNEKIPKSGDVITCETTKHLLTFTIEEVKNHKIDFINVKTEEK